MRIPKTLLIWGLVCSAACAQSAADARFRDSDRNDAAKPKESSEQASRFKVHTNLAYVNSGHERQVLDLTLPASKTTQKPPLVVFIHGGGWQNGSKDGAPIGPLVEAGFATAAINYRLSRHARFPAQIYDCKAAIRWLRAHGDEYGYDGSRIGVWGTSAGGHLVALLGTSGDVTALEGNLGETGISSRVQAVCDHFGPTDFLKMDEQAGSQGQIKHDEPKSPESLLIGGPIQEMRETVQSASPLSYVTADDPPFFIVHGDQDRLVPVQQSERLHQLLTEAKVESKLKIVKGAGHGQFKDPTVRTSLIEFFVRTLRLDQK